MRLRPGATGVLIVRMWLEEHETAPLRAVITSVFDMDAEADGEAAPITVSSPAEVLAVVEAWLDDLLGEPDCGPSE